MFFGTIRRLKNFNNLNHKPSPPLSFIHILLISWLRHIPHDLPRDTVITWISMTPDSHQEHHNSAPGTDAMFSGLHCSRGVLSKIEICSTQAISRSRSYGCTEHIMINTTVSMACKQITAVRILYIKLSHVKPNSQQLFYTSAVCRVLSTNAYCDWTLLFWYRVWYNQVTTESWLYSSTITNQRDNLPFVTIVTTASGDTTHYV